MKFLLILFLVFVVPMAGISIFIAFDKALDRFCKWLKDRKTK